MERHNTHILSCSSSLENNNSYKFDKNGNILLDSVSSVSYINYKRRNKITTSELFKEIKNVENNPINEEENVLNKNKDNNISLSKNQKNSALNKLNNKYQIISKTENFMYTPSGKENMGENNNINTTNQMYLQENKENIENNDNKIINNDILQKSNFNAINNKYDDKYLREIKLELIFLKSIKELKNNQVNNRNIKISKKEKDKDKRGTYEFKAKFSERMKFSSKTNSFLSPIKNKLKEKDIYFNNNEFIINRPINNICYITKINKYDQDKISKIKESIILDESENKDLYEKIIKNKYKISYIPDKKSILNKTNENEYNKDNKDNFNIPNDLEDNNNINNDINNNYQQIYNFKKENLTQRNYLMKNKNNEISNNPLLNQKTNKLNEKNNFHKHINAYSNKKQKIQNNTFYTPNKVNNNTIDNKIKTFYKINQINSPFLLMHKDIQKNLLKNKLFSNESTISKINSRRNIKYEKQNRNKSLVNIISHNHNHNQNQHNIDIRNQENNHFYEQLIINEGKKYDRHFGKEENCPICVALQVKNKLLEEKKVLPILKPSFLNKCEHQILTHSPNKYTENNKRIMSCKTNIIRKLNIRRNESAKQIMNKNRNIVENEKNDFIINKNAKDIFPCLNEYFNANK